MNIEFGNLEVGEKFVFAGDWFVKTGNEVANPLEGGEEVDFFADDEVQGE